MKEDVSKTNPLAEDVLIRLHSVHLSHRQLLEARAHAMRAEVIAELIARAYYAAKAGVRWVLARVEKLFLRIRVG